MRKRFAHTSGRPVRFSIVIVTYNRKESLQGSLAAVLAQDYHDYEVIVVDDGSTDGTGEMVRHLFPQVRYVAQPRNTGIPAARNRGLREATAEMVAFTDDDNRVPRDWLRRHAAYYADPRVSAVGGPQVCRTPNFYERFDVAQYRHRWEAVELIDRIERFAAIGTSNLSVRRSVLEHVGTFDERFASGEDADLVRRIVLGGYAFVRDPGLQVEHLKVNTFRSYLRMRFERACGSVLTDCKEGTLQTQRFLPLINVPQTWDNWRQFQRRFGAGVVACVGFWGLALLLRCVDVAGRVYYYARVGRHYRVRPQA